MAKFRKVICRPGVYRVNTPKGRQIKPITEKYLREVCNTANQMLEAGLKIPAPFAHKDGNKVVPGPTTQYEGIEVDAKTLAPPTWSSDFNAGFWGNYEIGPKGELVSVIDAPGDPEDENSVAGKISKTIKETSVFIDPEFTDGLGRVWLNALRHVALVNNAVEPDQKNFELITDPEYALAMSFSMADEVSSTYSGGKQESNSPGEKDTSDANGDDTTTDVTTDESSNTAANIPQIISLLKDKLGYEMPSNTDEKNFLDRLLTILVSITKEVTPDEELKDLERKPDKAKTESDSQISMSDENPDNVVFLTKMNKLVQKHVDNLRAEFKTRIQQLIATGRISKKHADTNLFPAVEAIAMSTEDMDDEGNFPKTAIEMSIEMVESVPSLFDNHLADSMGGDIEPNGDEGPVMNDTERNDLYAQIL